MRRSKGPNGTKRFPLHHNIWLSVDHDAWIRDQSVTSDITVSEVIRRCIDAARLSGFELVMTLTEQTPTYLNAATDDS